jgi:octaprenyl-diphosphate synthase
VGGGLNAAEPEPQRLAAAVRPLITASFEAVTWPDLARAVEWALERDAQQGERRQIAMLLPVYACYAAGGEPVAALPLGAGWRLLTLASALLDDLVDRDKPDALWAQWADARALHVGLGLIFAAQSALARLPDSVLGPVLRLVSGYLLIMTHGQATPNTELTATSYLRHSLAKAGMFAAAFAQAGACLATPDPRARQALFDFGLALGAIQQLTNDLFDFDKPFRTSDLARQHLTLPVIYALSRAVGSPDGACLPALFERRLTWEETDWTEFRKLLERLGVRPYIARLTAVYIAKAERALSVFPPDRTTALRILLPAAGLAERLS